MLPADCAMPVEKAQSLLGAADTRFWIDPREELIGVFMIQILPHNGLEYGFEFRVMVSQAIAD
jgi:hypothetical protein